MSIDSTSSTEAILAQYLDNCGWNGNPTKAALALQAAKMLTAKRPGTMTDGGGNTISYESLSAEIIDLQKFVNSTSTAVAARRSSFTRGVMPT